MSRIRTVIGTGLAATLGLGGVALAAPPASAAPSCLTLSRAIVMMARAAELSRQAGFMDVYQYRSETVLYYESLYEGQGCP